MRIGLIGGLERNEARYPALAARAGHQLECHDGHLRGSGVRSLEALVDRSDVVVVITDVNSHAAVWRARGLARARGRRCLLMRRCGTAQLARLFDSLTQEEQAKRPAAAPLRG